MPVTADLDRVFHAEWGRVLASLIGLLGSFELAEEAAQDAFTAAAERWPRDGVPEHPRAWLMATARNRAVDRIRRDRVLAQKVHLLARQEEPVHPTDPSDFPDERLELVFTCCHPALAVEAQVPLVLRTLGGLTTEDIARAFLVPVPCTGTSAGSPAHRSSNSTERSPSPRSRGPTSPCVSSTAWASRTTATPTPPARTCCAASDGARTPSRPTAEHRP